MKKGADLKTTFNLEWKRSNQTKQHKKTIFQENNKNLHLHIKIKSKLQSKFKIKTYDLLKQGNKKFRLIVLTEQNKNKKVYK